MRELNRPRGVEGQCTVLLAGHSYTVRKDEMIVLPANVPHTVKAETLFKMLLTMIRS